MVLKTKKIINNKLEYEPLKLLNCLGQQIHKPINAANLNSVHLG